MMTAGRVVAIALLATTAGFVGGVWSVATGVFDHLIARPAPPAVVGPLFMPAPGARGPGAMPVPPPPRVVAVAVPPARVYSGGSSFGPRANRLDLLPSPGCTWEVEPRPFALDRPWNETTPDHTLVAYAAPASRGDGIRFLLSQTARKGSTNVPLRVVLFDAAGERWASRPTDGRSFSRGSNGELDVEVAHLEAKDGADPATIAYFGIERVASDAQQKGIEAAQATAAERNLAILPPARVGEPYRFDLPTIDGKRVRTQDLRGKVVIVGVWGSGPYLTTAQSFLHRAREENSPDEVALVGISFDATVEDARKARDRSIPDDPVVHVPNDLASRRLWIEGSSISHLPAWFILDREGILRFTDSHGFDLNQRIDELFGRPGRFPFHRRDFVGPPRIPPGWIVKSHTSTSTSWTVSRPPPAPKPAPVPKSSPAPPQ